MSAWDDPDLMCRHGRLGACSECTAELMAEVARLQKENARLERRVEELEGETPGPTWACFDCGHMGRDFRQVNYEAGDCDLGCPECESTAIDEVSTVLVRLALRVDELNALAALARPGDGGGE